MVIELSIFMFVIGTILGSFYNVVGYRLPKGESIVSPPSHCPKCGKRLTPIELIPILSYIIQKGKCRHCNSHISLFYPIFEALTGLLFVLAYLSYGLTPQLIIVLTFISVMIIIVVSDYNYLIISDEVLITFAIILFLEILLINGLKPALLSLLNGLGASVTMYLLKKLGDFLFKKESMGGGDIKLLFIFGMVLTYPIAILSIFVGSVIGLPISLVIAHKNKNDIIPFGPFLAAGATILLLMQININTIINFYKS
jgi:prepilin signal peptidase PulO-like enzyme (type II secretory pathway)